MLSTVKKLLLSILIPALSDGDDIFSMLEDPPGSSTVHAALAAQLEEAHTEPERARPEQGGFRITPDWLYTLKPRDCLYRFRFYAGEMIDLAKAMAIPDPFITEHRYRFSAIEALGLLLARYKSAGDQYDLAMLYDRSQSAISEVVKELTVWLDDRWEHLLKFDTDGVLSPECLESYAAAIYAAGAPLRYIWAFLDCTIRPICRPSEFQEQCYNGYKKLHAMKFQAL
ncbi:hypothetical protein C8R44DRAFT_677100, partial [Mycena epipterygia]